MKIAETSRRKIGYKNTFIYFCICECENCKIRFNINKKFFDHAIKFNKPLPGRFCSVSCKKRYYKKKQCNVEGCVGKHASKGYCTKHYVSFKKYGDPLGKAGSYKCLSCEKSIRKKKNHKFLSYAKNICGDCLTNFLRELAIQKLGSKCDCCMERITTFLQIDHINEGGASERRLLGSKNKFHERVIENPKDYRLLCANCNWGNYILGKCPHKK